MKRLSLVTLVALVVLLFSNGCRPKADIGHVSGRVTWKGAPVVNATVTFQPAQGIASYGTTDDDGRFELKRPGGQLGATIGRHAVSIETYRIYTDEAGEPREHPETIPAQYNAESELTHEVKPGQQSVDFLLPRP